MTRELRSVRETDSMASTQERVTQAIFRAIEEVNRARVPEQRLAKSLDTILMGRPGEPGHLDSLGLVNLVVGIEEQLEDEFGVTVNIADARARSHEHNPLTDVRTLAGYIGSLIRTNHLASQDHG